ncbi:NAD(P)-binding domain-containing protein [Aliiroseovarius crassostreae]|uniref:NAD(P)-binding domain-containing protein n=1 Tax=Aliiroseovarius crassostreae TaxID=154981 RepID=UPI00220D23AE|nr:NAD(P)-binding domain-containing protein [Aliiroseovarius crassostreae]UWP89841.1 NAD(P)-binding domain-containing protein [Aliiroseovarius crassostreae]
MARIGFIGTGTIASAMVAGLAGQGHQILISPRNREVAERLCQAHAEVEIAENAAIAARADVVFICLLADVALDVLPDLPFHPAQAVISVMTDLPLADLRRLCAPATDLAIAIPLPSIATGGSALPVYPDNVQLARLFGDRNRLIPCRDEHALNAHFAASALASPILDQMRQGAAWLADQTGDSKMAEAFVATMFSGFLSNMAADDEVGFERLLQDLSTEGGLNASLRDHMRDKKALQALREGLDLLKPRLDL